ncbi:transposase [Marinobacteraceae bacterium S3BR75-40.1]
MPSSLLVAIDVGSQFHQVAVGDDHGRLIDEFRVDHAPTGFTAFFERVEGLRGTSEQVIRVAMEGYNGWARPLDSLVLERGWELYNVNNLKLARYKEIFPAPAKTDAIDSRRMLELFSLSDQRGVARNALQAVPAIPERHRRLKYLTRRRRLLVQERSTRLTRLRCDLQALSPGLLNITGAVDNKWFLRLLTCRDRLTALPRLRTKTLMGIRGVGACYVAKIQTWQKEARFAPDIAFADTDVVDDARTILALDERIAVLDADIEQLCVQTAAAQIVRSIPGFGATGVAELIGEIGTFARFRTEAGLAVYVGMAPLDQSSGVRNKGKKPKSINTRCQLALMTCIVRHMACRKPGQIYFLAPRSKIPR